MYKIEKGIQSIIQYILLKDAKSAAQQDKRSCKKASVCNLPFDIEEEGARKTFEYFQILEQLMIHKQILEKDMSISRNFNIQNIKGREVRTKQAAKITKTEVKLLNNSKNAIKSIKKKQQIPIKGKRIRNNHKNKQQTQKKQENILINNKRKKKIYNQKEIIEQINIMRTQSKI
ncbi:unnamed protein product [Paramecium pentaurelia]|uniref:Uncharacterized protein n=1 Tax=Paramecium pentaurelia TaxID=43138 RepID=A0A8S1X935_9CILI|nr:unnamed protein product [Paramecium pentaurelia]